MDYYVIIVLLLCFIVNWVQARLGTNKNDQSHPQHIIQKVQKVHTYLNMETVVWKGLSTLREKNWEMKKNNRRRSSMVNSDRNPCSRIQKQMDNTGRRLLIKVVRFKANLKKCGYLEASSAICESCDFMRNKQMTIYWNAINVQSPAMTRTLQK